MNFIEFITTSKAEKNNKTKFIDGLSDALHLKMERENDYNQ